MNIALEYVYRDGGNNKLWNKVVFQNRSGINLELLETRIRAALIDSLWFDAQQVAILSLKFEKYDQELDHGWHEFHTLFETTDDATNGEVRDIKEIVEAFEKLKVTLV